MGPYTNYMWGYNSYQIYQGGGFKYVLCSPLLGEMIQVDEHIFQMGLVQPPTKSYT